MFLEQEKEVLKKLEKSYREALEEINDKIELLLARQDADMQHVIYQVEYQKALKSQVSTILEQLHNNEFETISEYLRKSYEDGFIGTMYDLQGQGIPLIIPLDQTQIVSAIQHETKLSESLYESLGKDTKQLSKQIAAEISRGVSRSVMYSEIAKNVALYGKIPKNNAMRIARTEAHRIQIQATADAQRKAKDNGADVVKQWDSALDKRTRDSHMELDGQIRELEEEFEVNGHKALHPGGFGVPEEDINCRCALLQRARWNLGHNYTKWDENAPVEIADDGTSQLAIIEAKNYEDFKAKYNKAVETLLKSSKILAQRNYASDLSQKFGKNYYDSMHDLIDSCENEELKAVWGIYEPDIGVGDAEYKGHEHFKPAIGKIYVNGKKDAKGNDWQEPYQVTFHESGHNIDWVANAKAGGNKFKPFSYTYENNKFGNTITEEVNALVSKYDKEMKAEYKKHKEDYEWLHENGFISDWAYAFYITEGVLPTANGTVKYSKKIAYSKLQKEVRKIDKKSRSDLSDILEGATKGKIKCGFGHGNSYWKTESNLPAEAFAEMISGETTNHESLKTIKKYLPKSYEVFKEILAAMKGV